MKILIRYFAVLREEKRCNEEWVQLDKPLSISQLFVHLFGRKPIGIRFAVNCNYVLSDQLLVDGDEVAFLPPLGGG